MEKQNELRVDLFRRRPSNEGLPAGESTGDGVASDFQPAAPNAAARRLNTWRPDALAAGLAMRFVGSLLAALVILLAPAACPAQVAVGVSVTIGPPALPVYTQPFCPGPGYIWTPGYWAWDASYGYYWVPGTWVLAPFPGALWTPGYWGWNGGAYIWNVGYWGPAVGFYGGINYGFGYTGSGYQGGYWRRGAFYYNRSVNNVRVTNIRNVYNRTVINNVNVSRVSYNGGRGGATVRATATQLAAARQRRAALTPVQRQQEQAARANPRQRASVNHGRPAIAATPRPGVFTGRGVVQARSAGAPYRAAPLGAAARRAPSRTANPAGTGRRPLVTAPRRAAAPQNARGAGSRGQQPVRRTPRPSAPYAAQPRQNASRPPVTRRSAPARSGTARPQTQRRAAPRQQRAPHAPPRGANAKPRKPGESHE